MIRLINFLNNKVSKKAETMNRYNQVQHLTQDTTWESDKNTRKHHIQESLEVSPFLAGDHQTRKHDKHETNNERIGSTKPPLRLASVDIMKEVLSIVFSIGKDNPCMQTIGLNL